MPLWSKLVKAPDLGSGDFVGSIPTRGTNVEVAQLVERHVANVEVARSYLVFYSKLYINFLIYNLN